jgi:hypothetical protein
MSEPAENSLALWKMLLIALVAAGLGHMLAEGIMPFQPIPFEKWGFAPKWVPYLFGGFCALFAAWLVALRGAFSRGSAKLGSWAHGIGPSIARLIAPHLAAAAAEIAKEAAPEPHEATVSQTLPQSAPQAPAPQAPPLPEAVKHA